MSRRNEPTVSAELLDHHLNHDDQAWNNLAEPRNRTGGFQGDLAKSGISRPDRNAVIYSLGASVSLSSPE